MSVMICDGGRCGGRSPGRSRPEAANEDEREEAHRHELRLCRGSVRLSSRQGVGRGGRTDGGGGPEWATLPKQGFYWKTPAHSSMP